MTKSIDNVILCLNRKQSIDGIPIFIQNVNEDHEDDLQ